MKHYCESESRRRFLAASAASSAALMLGMKPAEAEARRRPPNFIVILTDDQGYQDVGCYGAPLIRTPRLDRMAAEGMKLTSFYAAPVCTPSRARIVTGCYPPRVGLPNVLNANSDTGISDRETTIAEVLKERGYATGCIGKWHLGYQPKFLPTRHGFDSYFGLPYSNDMNRKGNEAFPVPLMRNEKVIERPAVQETLTERYTEEAIRFIRRNRTRPFFLYLPHTFPHVPLHVSERFRGKSKGGLYGDVIECLDWSTGQILDALKEEGLDDNTLVIFTSDNGPWLVKGNDGGSALPLRAGKGTTYEGGVRVPCIARWPGRIPAGTVCPEMAANFDIYPTLAKLAGATVPEDRIIDGRDIWPLLSGQPGAKSPHEALFYYRGNALQAVRSGRWKLILEHQPQGSKETTPLALYDLETDIGETRDLSAGYPKLVQRLQQMAEKCRDDIGDSVTGRTGRNCRPPGKV